MVMAILILDGNEKALERSIGQNNHLTNMGVSVILY